MTQPNSRPAAKADVEPGFADCRPEANPTHIDGSALDGRHAPSTERHPITFTTAGSGAVSKRALGRADAGRRRSCLMCDPDSFDGWPGRTVLCPWGVGGGPQHVRPSEPRAFWWGTAAGAVGDASRLRARHNVGSPLGAPDNGVENSWATASMALATLRPGGRAISVQ
jgi:hypothetical protein